MKMAATKKEADNHAVTAEVTVVEAVIEEEVAVAVVGDLEAVVPEAGHASTVVMKDIKVEIALKSV